MRPRLLLFAALIAAPLSAHEPGIEPPPSPAPDPQPPPAAAQPVAADGGTAEATLLPDGGVAAPGAVVVAPEPAGPPPVAPLGFLRGRFPQHRWRFGVGYWFGAGTQGIPGTGGVGAQLRAGLQLNDGWAAFIQLQASTQTITGLAAGNLMVERSFFDGLLSAGLGVGVAGTWASGAGNPNATSNQGGIGLGVPLRIAVLLGPDAAFDHRRQRFFIAGDGWLGGVLSSTEAGASALGWYLGVGIGYEMM
jgi:hypothetical protein